MATVVSRLEAVLTANVHDFNRKMDQSEGRMAKVGKVAGVAGLAIAGGLAVGLEKSVHAALDAQVSQNRLEQAFRNAHLEAKVYEAGIGRLEKAGRRLGFTDEQTKEALGSLITATHNYRKAASELSVVQDIARFKHVSLVDATKMLTMAQTGSQRAARQLGISVPPVTAAYDALGKNASVAEKAHARLQDKMATGNAVIDAVRDHVHGQADAFSKTAQGGMEQFHAQLQHIEVAIGTKVLPALNWLITKGNELMAWFEQNWPTISKVVRRVMHALRPIIEPILNEIKAIFHVIGDAIHGDWSGVWEGLKKIVRADLTLMRNLISGAAHLFYAALSALGGLALDGLRAGLSGVGNLVTNHVIDPFTSTISGAWKAVKRAVTNLFGKVIGWVKDVLGIGSPSKIFHEIGQNVVKGFVNGVGSMAGVLKHAVTRMVGTAAHKLGVTFGVVTPHGKLSTVSKDWLPEKYRGLTPQVLRALDFASSHGWHGTVTSGYRTYAEQAALYKAYKEGRGPLAAPPGHSSHETGQAVDVTDYGTFGRIMAHAPAFERLYNRLGGRDPVHFSVSGYDRGGIVRGPGRTDTVPAMLTPGEMVLNQRQQELLGGQNLLRRVLGFAAGGIVPQGRGHREGEFYFKNHHWYLDNAGADLRPPIKPDITEWLHVNAFRYLSMDELNHAAKWWKRHFRDVILRRLHGYAAGGVVHGFAEGGIVPGKDRIDPEASRGLDLMKRAWAIVGPTFFGHGGSMPNFKLTHGTGLPFVDGFISRDGKIGNVLESIPISFLRMVARGVPSVLNTVIHEWAHVFQKKRWESGIHLNSEQLFEGGAITFAQDHAQDVWGGLGMGYKLKPESRAWWRGPILDNLGRGWAAMHQFALPPGFRPPNVYDKGGWLQPGLTLAMNATGQPERVIAPGQGGDTVIVQVGAEEVARVVFDHVRGKAQVFQRRNNRPAFGV
jgi:hypothetical protein